MEELCKEMIPCFVCREARKAADTRQKVNKYRARALYLPCLQGLCQLQDTVLPVLFKGFDGRK